MMMIFFIFFNLIEADLIKYNNEKTEKSTKGIRKVKKNIKYIKKYVVNIKK